MEKDEKTYNNDYMCVVCDYEQLGGIRDFISVKALQFGFSDDEAYRISLAVDEACTNLIRYAYKLDTSRKICVNIETQTSQFIVNVLDDGTPFNPLDIPSPEMEKYFKEFRRGGLGIHIMRTVMDRIEYQPATGSGSKNVLKLIKNLTGITSGKALIQTN
jgi:serine/threonine-protein kinase RsbW